MTDDFEAIKEYVLDHYEHFGAYPMEVETDTQVYTFDQYWAILADFNIEESEKNEKVQSQTSDTGADKGD